MIELMINGIPVEFPHEKPYDGQIMIMNTALSAMKSKKNAIIESPTGSGKTAALLASSLAYQKTDDDCRIFYSSRTHTQLNQVIQEYKQLDFRAKMTVLASRKRFCINEAVKNSPNINYECQYIVNKNECKFRKKSTNIAELTSNNGPSKFDIEDLIVFGKEIEYCPYYLSLSLADSARIVFCTYNHILSANPVSNITTDDSICIFDEGHNIENFSMEATSFSANYQTLHNVLNVSAEMAAHNPDDLTYSLIHKIATMMCAYVYQTHQQLLNSELHYKADPNLEAFLNSCNISLRSSSIICTELIEWVKVAANMYRDRHIDYLLTFATSISNPLSIVAISNIKSFQILYIHNEVLNQSMFKIICLDPSVVFKQKTSKISTVILSSATLSPMNYVVKELGVAFPFTVSTPHIISPDRLVALKVDSINNTRMTSNYNYFVQKKIEISENLGSMVELLSKNVIGGILLFVPSYNVKDEIIKNWKETGMFEKIEKHKKIFEEKQGESPKSLIREYNKTVGKGILIGVSRGSLSEGIDYKDDQCRIVIAFGIPYASFTDPVIVLKKEWNDSQKNGMTGWDWYSSLAFRTLYQTIGRCIRHKNDFGTIILVDDRISGSLNGFPDWVVRSYAGSFSSINAVFSTVTSFLITKQGGYDPNYSYFIKHIPKDIISKVYEIPEFVKVSSDAKFKKLIQHPSFQRLLKSPTFQKLLTDRVFFNKLISEDFQEIVVETLYIDSVISQDLKETIIPIKRTVSSGNKPNKQKAPPSKPAIIPEVIDNIDFEENTKLPNFLHTITPSMSFFCSKCHQDLFSISKVDDLEFLKVKREGLLKLLQMVNSQPVMLVYHSNMKMINLIFGNDEWNESDLTRYMCVHCQCKNTLGIQIMAAPKKESHLIGSYAFLVNSIRVNINGKFLSFQEIGNIPM